MVFKSRWMIERYQALIKQLQPRLILELGIYKGGSSVLFHRLAEPEKLVALELSSDRIASLDEYIEKTAGDTVKPFYGIDQASEKDIKRVIQEEFGDRKLDLVLDDASHFLEETTCSFNLLFPRLRKGGVYVIEDWSWGHGSLGEQPQFADREPLSKLILEIVMACPSSAGLINKVEINRNTAFVWRGGGAIEEEHFAISRCITGRAKNLIV